MSFLRDLVPSWLNCYPNKGWAGNSRRLPPVRVCINPIKVADLIVFLRSTSLLTLHLQASPFGCTADYPCELCRDTGIRQDARPSIISRPPGVAKHCGQVAGRALRDRRCVRISVWVLILGLKGFSGYWAGGTTRRAKKSWDLRFGLLGQNVESTETTLLNLNHETQVWDNETTENSITE